MTRCFKLVLLIVTILKATVTKSAIIADKCSSKDTCESCVTHEDCHWVTLWEGTSLCFENMAKLGIEILRVVTPGASVHCETPFEALRPSLGSLDSQLEKQTSTKFDDDLKNHAQSVLIQSNATIESTEFFLYKQKTLLSLKFLNLIIPRMQFVQQNMSALFYSYSQYGNMSNSKSIVRYKVADKIIDDELLDIENQISRNRLILKEYMDAYLNVEHQLTIIHDTLERVLAGDGVTKTNG